MNIKQIASNMTEVSLNDITILFSYETPVAGWDSKGAFRTDVWYSATTTRHINKYLGGKTVGRIVPQSHINFEAQNGGIA